MRPQPRQRGPRRLFHHVAELTGQRQRAGARHARRLHEEHFAADRRPCEADGHARILRTLLHLLVEKPRRAEHLDHHVPRDLDRRFVAFGAPARHLAAERADLALEVADAGLAGVAADHLSQRVGRESDVFRRQPVVLHLLVHEVIERDLQLFFLGVPGQLQHFHAVAECRRNRIEHVRRGDEQHFGQIERDIEIVIAERVVLLRIEHLEQRRRGIAAEIRSELVDLVEDEDRVLRLRAAQTLNHLPRQRADVRPAVSADFRLVAHPAERDANEFAAERLRDGSRKRRLADAGRADEAQDRTLHLGVQLADGQVLEDAILCPLQA